MEIVGGTFVSPRITIKFAFKKGKVSRIDEVVCQRLDGKTQPSLAALFVSAILQGELTAVSLGDLPAED
jgi:hypothetical protein